MRTAAFGVLAGALTLGAAGAARAQNLVPDPAFTHGVGAWSPTGITGNFTMTFVPDFSHRPGSGSALLSYTSPEAGGFTVCVPVVGGRPYDFGYSIYFPDANRVAGLNEGWAAFDTPDCSGTSAYGFLLPIFPQPGEWFSPESSWLMPATSRSVLLRFGALGVGGAQPIAYLDDVFFAPAGTVPPIDPPPDIPTLSVAGLLACAAGLAFAAFCALRREA